MLPSVLAHEIRESTRRFLVTGFEPSDAFFGGVVQRYVDGPGGVGKGPYLQIGLPFQGGKAGRDFFTGFQTEYPGFAHQEAAWRRLAGSGGAANTLVATGTGSGKTECFLYPILDHCMRARAQGKPHGIKALVIYPMNALANDQARRFAGLIAKIGAFHGLRVGVYTGGRKGAPGTGTVMGPDSVITDRDTLRKAPPDVLLTNYKMLDYLLIRPKDRALWRYNEPDTLRYVVVDELHTFDGAQGTDLAMLLRRLRARLKVPPAQWICVGTSATLGEGDASGDAPLRDYAHQIFNSAFPAGSVVTEYRDSVADFLGNNTVEHVLQPTEDFVARLDPASYPTVEATIAGWFVLLLPDQPAPKDVSTPVWRQHLGDELKRHILVQNLLRVLQGGVKAWPELAEQLAGPLPGSIRPSAARVLDALVALMAWARSSADPTQPFVTIRVHLWMRELRRMTASVTRERAQVALLSAADLKANPDRIHLPLVQCSECHATGWLSRRDPHSTRVDQDLETIYNAWFRAAPEVLRLYPVTAIAEPQCQGLKLFLCGQCGTVQGDGDACQGCGGRDLVEVWEVAEQHQVQRGNATFNLHTRVCPACGARDRLLLFGARNATLGAQLIEQTWATRFNDDRKLIAFSDSVQDAAHRAGFFSSRTYLNNVRMALTQALTVLAKPNVGWSEFLRALPAFWRERMPRAGEFVTEFIGPNMQWQHDWEVLQREGRLPSGSRLPGDVENRLAWQAIAEFTYLSRRGRTLDRLAIATLAPAADAVDHSAAVALDVLREQFGLRDLPIEHVVQWLWGFVIHLRQRGAVVSPGMERLAEDGNMFGFARAQSRERWLPPLGQRAARPVFLLLGASSQRDFDSLVQRGHSWYEQWMKACLARGNLQPGSVEDLYSVAVDALAASGLLHAESNAWGRSVGLAADALALHTDTARLASVQGTRALTVPTALAERLLGMPCLDAMQETYADVLHRSSEPPIVWRYRHGKIRRVIAAEHTGLLDRDARELLEGRFRGVPPPAQPWYENLLSATPTLEMGVDIGNLSSVLMCSVPPSQASYLQRSGRAGRRDGNALVATLASGASPHDLYFYAQPLELMAGRVVPPGVFLGAAEVLRRQLFAFCLDGWVASGIPDTAMPDKTGAALDAVERLDERRFPYTFFKWIQTREDELLQGFLVMLGDALQPKVEERLTKYLHEQGDDDGLRVGLLKFLQGLMQERVALRKRSQDIRQKVAALRNNPPDEATRAEIDDLEREKEVALSQSRSIAGKPLLETLTDAGLIPNYAFPEAGIELKSLVWRRRDEGEGGNGRYTTLPVETYERPAASALSEFAPENRFYANRRRVEINQINLELAQAEDWRLCPSCQHAEPATVGDAVPACPRCGDAMWSDAKQKHTLLRFRQALANSNDRDSRIDDSSDDREPRFFLRQLLADVDPKNIRYAWKVTSEATAFGFEYIQRVTFRDINFGERGKQGDSFKVADFDAPRPGFKLCRHCGMVQTPSKRRHRDGSPPPAQQHARDCRAYGGDNPDDLFECLYLYREFSSEALRILVPFMRDGLDETALQSFMAALQLGLKRRFGGRIDHLRITDQELPDRETGGKRQYVLLYDSVPGGTGYLQQLLSEKAKTLKEVLKEAYRAIRECPCNEDPEKDGCYRCVYQYRQGRAMAQVSRRTAERILGELLGSLDHLEPVASVADIFVNPQFGSELEKRFVESLRRLSGVEGLPTIRVAQEVVAGKPGWLLEVGNERYWVVPQVDVGVDTGVSEASRPDFVISAVNAGAQRRPIAVFTDGWAYHKDSMRADARKRSALVASGRYWVWSLTWEAVAEALKGSATRTLDLEFLWPRPESANLVEAARQHLHARPHVPENGVAELVRWLALSTGDNAMPQALDARRRVAALAVFGLTPGPSTKDAERAASAMSALERALPDGAVARDTNGAFAASADAKCTVRACVWWPQAWLSGEIGAGHGAVWLQSQCAKDDVELRAAWRQWLAAFNRLQVLPNMFLVEDAGLQHGDYAAMGAAASRGQATGPRDPSWEAAIESALAVVRPGLQQLQAAGAPVPSDVGFELEVDGMVVAEAELAWTAYRVAVLLGQQAEQADVWRNAGWSTVPADTAEWEKVVRELIKEQSA